VRVELKNYELVPALDFLSGMSVPANESRPISKFKKLIVDAIEDLQEAQMEIIERCGQKDEKGNVAIAEDGSGYILLPEKQEEYTLETHNLLSEVVVFDGGTHAKTIEKISGILQEYTAEISGKDAEIYDRLLDEFEKG